jgi:hypothetical protein
VIRTSLHHHIITSSHHHIITSSHHRIITSEWVIAMAGSRSNTGQNWTAPKSTWGETGVAEKVGFDWLSVRHQKRRKSRLAGVVVCIAVEVTGVVVSTEGGNQF